MIRNQDDWLTGQIDTIIKLLAQLYFQGDHLLRRI